MGFFVLFMHCVDAEEIYGTTFILFSISSWLNSHAVLRSLQDEKKKKKNYCRELEEKGTCFDCLYFLFISTFVVFVVAEW
jgi:putative Ca2+/H+ antiporter (TMEM165/GDT1 family)